MSMWIFSFLFGLGFSRFRFGPAESLWRSLTYGRAQPMRLAPRGATEPAVS